MSLDRPEYWRYLSDDSEDAAVDALLERLDPLDPDPVKAARYLRSSVAFLERATGWFFRRRDGTLELDGTDAPRLWLPYPVVSADQVEDALDVAISVDDSEVDATTFRANDGAFAGFDDPRSNPFVELIWSSSQAIGRLARFPQGVRNVAVTASWGFLEEDGTTPEPILEVLSRLVALKIGSTPDLAGTGPAAAALLSESVEGRTYTYSADAASFGLTLDRDTDAILVGYARPPEVIVSRSRNRGSRNAGSHSLG